MTTKEEMKPIAPTKRLRKGAIEDEIDDFYDNNDIMGETVEEEESYEVVENTDIIIPVITDDQPREVIGELAEDESDVEPAIIPTTAQHLLEPPQPYDPMRDAPPPKNAGPSYRPLLKKNEQCGDTCLPKSMYDDDCIRIYSKNMNGIYDKEGMELDAAFTSMHEVEADIFTFNKTHGDDQNLLTRQALTKS